jgi:hypothetical protein
MTELSRLVGLEVEQVWVWGPVRLVFDLGAPPETLPAYVDLGTPFRLVDARGVLHEVGTSADPKTAGPVLGLLNQRLVKADAPRWRLELAFADGSRITCPPHAMYEAWEASVPGVGAVICLPGAGDEGLGLIL